MYNTICPFQNRKASVASLFVTYGIKNLAVIPTHCGNNLHHLRDVKGREAFLVKSYRCLCCYKVLLAPCKMFIRKLKTIIISCPKVTEGGNLLGFKDGKEVHRCPSTYVSKFKFYFFVQKMATCFFEQFVVAILALDKRIICTPYLME